MRDEPSDGEKRERASENENSPGREALVASLTGEGAKSGPQGARGRLSTVSAVPLQGEDDTMQTPKAGP